MADATATARNELRRLHRASEPEVLKPLLAANSIDFRYPTLVWWNDKGEMRACACENAQSYRFVRRELGA